MDTNKCRICLTSINLTQNIFKTTNTGQIYTKIMSLTKVQVSIVEKVLSVKLF